MKIGVQLFTLRKYGQTEQDLADLFQNIAKMGYSVVQYSGLIPIGEKIKPTMVENLAEKNGLFITLTHTNPTRVFENTDEVGLEHHVISCPTVGIGCLPGEYRESEEKVKEFCRKMNQAEKVLKTHGKTLAYHNHDFEFNYVGQKRIIDILLEELSPTILLTLDTYWLKYAGENPEEWIRKCQGRIKDLHIKDWTDELTEQEKAEGKKAQMKSIGEGKLDFKSLLKTAEECGVQTALIELDNAEEPYEAVQSSTDYLKKIVPQYF